MIEIIKQLEATNSRNEKEAILASLPGDKAKLFKYIAYLAYDPSIDFYVKNFNEDRSNTVPSMVLSEALKDLESMIASRVFTGKRAKQWIEMTYTMLDDDTAEIFKRVIKRDLRCGISAKTVNKIWPGAVYEHPYMRCSGFSEKNLANISLPCWSQTKMDGLYIDIMVYEDKVVYRTRNGSILDLNEADFDRSLIMHFKNQVLMGEALAYNELGEMLDRQTGNGYLNSNDINSELVKFFVWDMVPMEDFEAKKSVYPYEDRFNDLCSNLDFMDHERIDSVDTVLCQSKEEIIEHFRINRLAGEEGTVLKDLKKLQWKSGTSKHQIKVKVIFDCDLKLVGWKEGVGKYTDMLGAIVCQSSDGDLEVSIGSGFTDAQRAELIGSVEDMIEEGTIVTVKANDVVTNQANPDKYALFLPRFVEFRKDKTEADSLKKIQDQVKEFTNALDMLK